MGGNQLYANGRIAVLSSKLFGTDKFTRLAECNTVSEALKFLSENGYGSGASENCANDCEKILTAETDGVLSLLKELCYDANAKKYFLAKYDYVNAKLLMKGKYMRTDNVGYCFKSASFQPAETAEAFTRDDYSQFGENLENACCAIDAEFADGRRSPQIVDHILDKAMYRDMEKYAKKSGFNALKKVFDWQVNTTNLMTLYRLKKAGLSLSEVSRWFVEGGSVSIEVMTKLYNDENCASDLPSEYKSFFELCKSGNEDLMAAEAAQQEQIRKTVCDDRDFLTVQPVIAYYLDKIGEINKVRKILVGIKSGQDKEKIKDVFR